MKNIIEPIRNSINEAIEFICTELQPESKTYIGAVWSPQHAPRIIENHYAYNFPNTDWEFNKDKGCFEIYMRQRGMFNRQTCYFTTIETAVGSHNIQFASFEQYQNAQTSPRNL